MSSPWIENATRVLLAALVLTAAVAPPALRNSHALEQGGEVHHRHDANHDANHDAGNGHVHHGEHGKHHLSASRQIDTRLSSGDRWHLHFHLLGFEFTLPEPASDQGDRESSGQEAVSVVPFAHEPVPCRTTQTASAWQTFPPFTAVLPEDAAFLQVVVISPPPVSCPRLCDRARRERSGVLIA